MLNPIKLEDYNKNDNLTVVNPNNDEELVDNLDVFYEKAENDFLDAYDKIQTKNLQNALKTIDTILDDDCYKKIIVSEKDRIKIEPLHVIDYIKDTIADSEYNFDGMQDESLIGLEDVQKAIEEFNSKQTGWINGNIIGVLNIADDVKRYLIAHVIGLPELYEYLINGNTAIFDSGTKLRFDFDKKEFELEIVSTTGHILDYTPFLEIAREFAPKISSTKEWVNYWWLMEQAKRIFTENNQYKDKIAELKENLKNAVNQYNAVVEQNKSLQSELINLKR